MVWDHLPAMKKGQGGRDVEIRIQHQYGPRWAFSICLQVMHLPPPAAHTSNEPNAANSVGCGWFWTTCLREWVATGEVDVFNIIFLHTKIQITIDYIPNTHRPPLKTPQPLLQSRARRKDGCSCSKGFEQWKEATQKYGFMLRQKIVCGGANRDGNQWSEGIGLRCRGEGRGRSNQKVCFLAAGRDTATEREGCDDRHGREAKKRNYPFIWKRQGFLTILMWLIWILRYHLDFGNVVEVEVQLTFWFPKNNYVPIASDSFWCARKIILNNCANRFANPLPSCCLACVCCVCVSFFSKLVEPPKPRRKSSMWCMQKVAQLRKAIAPRLKSQQTNLEAFPIRPWSPGLKTHWIH
jgi:hypothetical protein